MFDKEQRIRELEKDVKELGKDMAVMKADVQRMRDRWAVWEATWHEAILELCKEFDLDIPESYFK